MKNKLSFSTAIGGNKCGMMRLIYESPQFFCDDATIGVRTVNQTEIYVDDRSPFNNGTTIYTFGSTTFELLGWNSKICREKICYITDGDVSGVYYLNEGPSMPSTTYVDDDFGESTPGWNYSHFNSIQKGIDATSDKVMIYSGTYNENVIINRNVNITWNDVNVDSVYIYSTYINGETVFESSYC
jgi:hypothetical protein